MTGKYLFLLFLVLVCTMYIADENSGGFPNAKNNGMTESKREMKAPSLVARLMGLESMPAGSGSKPQKASASETWSNMVEQLGARPGGSDKEDMDFEMAEIKSSEPGLQRFRAKCALTYPTTYFSPLEDEADLVGNSLDHHSTDSYLSSSPNSSSSMVPIRHFTICILPFFPSNT